MHLITELWGAYLSAARYFRSLPVLGNKSTVIEGRSYSLVMFIQASGRPRLSKLTVITTARWYSGKESVCQCMRCRKPRKYWFTPWVGKIPGVGNGNPLQYSCLENSMAKGAWWAIIHGVTKSWTWLSIKHAPFIYLLLCIKAVLRVLYPFYSLIFINTFETGFINEGSGAQRNLNNWPKGQSRD